MNEAQMDFILEMYSKDHPDEFKFKRNSQSQDKDNYQSAQIGWADRLIGSAKDAFMKTKLFKIPQEYRTPAPPTKPPDRVE